MHSTNLCEEQHSSSRQERGPWGGGGIITHPHDEGTGVLVVERIILKYYLTTLTRLTMPDHMFSLVIVACEGDDRNSSTTGMNSTLSCDEPSAELNVANCTGVNTCMCKRCYVL